MVRVHIICEGQTEETFVKELLLPAFLPRNIHLLPALIGKPGHKGGNIKVERLQIDVRNRLLGDRSAYCTTFFDYYGLSSDFPGKSNADTLPMVREKSDRIKSALVEAFSAPIGQDALWRFIPYVQMHEFESLLFSNPSKFASGIDQSRLGSQFQAIRDQFKSPEDINDDPMTAPSKRILNLVAEYEKPLHGVLAAIEIGLSAMRAECALFDEWLKQLEALDPL